MISQLFNSFWSPLLGAEKVLQVWYLYVEDTSNPHFLDSQVGLSKSFTVTRFLNIYSRQNNNNN